MIPYLQLDNLSKSWGDLPLFENISFTINQGDKVALIAKNGAGKTTLMNIIFGREVADNGKIILNNDIRIGYLQQLPELNPDETYPLAFKFPFLFPDPPPSSRTAARTAVR